MSVSILTVAERWDVAEVECRQSILLAADPPEIIKIIRLLSGTLSVSSADTSLAYALDQDFINPNRQVSIENIDHFLSDLFDEVPDERDLIQLFRLVSSKNKGFYLELKKEVECLIRAICAGNSTESFLFLYRMVERISSACPLIYISREADFKAAHSFLSSIYDENKAPGELGMLKKFLGHYAKINDNFAQATLDFNLGQLSEPFAGSITKELQRITDGEISSIIFDEQSERFTVPYKDVGSFIVTVRNRTFHNEGGRKNVDLQALGGAEPLFKFLVPVLLTWLSFIFVDVGKWQISSCKI